MQIVIDIPNKDIPQKQDILTVDLHFIDGNVCECTYPFEMQELCDDKGEISDGYHTFNQLYHQRAVLFAAIVNQNQAKAWKSFKHEDGQYCFDSNGEWFIVGVDTPQGNYTYHYSKEYWDMFHCQELERGKHWDGHTEEDVVRLLTLEQEPCEDYISREVVKSDYADWFGYGYRDNAFYKHLCNMPSVQPKPTECEDCISREAVLNGIFEDEYIKNHINGDTWERIEDIVDALPSVQSKQRTGYWIDADGDNAICGCCNRLNHLYGNYCKHCGAKMEVDE